MLDSKEVTISVNPQEPLPTVSVERCDGVYLHFYEPSAMGSVYTLRCSKVLVNLQPPHPESSEIVVEDNEKQHVTKFADGKLSTSVVIRGELLLIGCVEEVIGPMSLQKVEAIPLQRTRQRRNVRRKGRVSCLC